MTRVAWMLVAAIAPLGCSADDVLPPGDADSGFVTDGASSDGGADTGSSTPPPDSGSGGTGEPIAAGPESGTADVTEDPSLFAAGDPSSCWDGIDNDGSSEQDCDDGACAGVPACALGSGTRCAGELVSALMATSCAAGPATPACLGIAATTFGDPEPWVAGDRLHPGGAGFDSGLVFDDALDPRTRRVTMTGTFAMPTCPSGEICVEVAAFGITTSTRFDGATRVAPTVALQMSGARSEVALLIGGSVVDRWEFMTTAPAWTLDLRPTGDVVVRNGETLVFRGAYAPPAAASAAVWGRNTNRAEMDPGGAGLLELSLGTSLCDIPDAWTAREPLSFTDPSGGAYVPSSPRGPSVARGGDGRLYLAFEVAGAGGQGRIALAAQEAGETDGRFTLTHAAAGQLLSPADVPGGATRVGDPELHWDDAASIWHLYFTSQSEAGVRRVGHASGSALDALAFDGWVVEPMGDILSVDMPSVARSNDGRFILAARVEKTDGAAIGIFVGDDPAAPFERHGGVLETNTFRPTSGASFDADEIGAPSIGVVDGAYQLYFAGRRGTRWNIGVWTSGELVYWRAVTGPDGILAGDGAGFDALGTRDPEALVEAAVVRLFHLGDDGAVQRLGVAVRPHPVGL